MPALSKPEIQNLLSKLKAEIRGGNGSDLHISDLIYDSRLVQEGSTFFCIPGEKTDGNQFIEAAIKSGARCIVSERQHGSPGAVEITVPDVRLALAEFAAALYDSPSRKLRLIAVTGTNGKTTTTHLLEHILNRAGLKTGLIGTLGSRSPGKSEYKDAKHTTPQAPELQKMLASMYDDSCTHIAMEVSSHALALKRVAACHFSVACLTNITQDHLDFHKTMENYWKSKRLLFEALNESAQSSKLALVNLDDPLAFEFLNSKSSSVKALSYGFSEKADFHPLSLDYKNGRSLLRLKSPQGELDLSMRLLGRFNVYNCLAALAICLEEGVSAEIVKEALADFEGVPGRFETVSAGQKDEPLCIVDYAHTPDGLENVLKTASALKKTGSRLICVFGCGGDRDPSKRPQMGKIAEDNADLLVVTSDNPRSENPQEIIAQILSGIKRLKSVEVEADRKAAIRMAVAEAGADDIVLVAGKGHENYQLVGDKVLPFDDKVELKKALELRLKQNCS
ncbi:MAG: UDP-N-acetylmuramoyl-L-alanyl-D-glutamate--2,6-diaminopimelate ligase [Candidatus Obscuribacterales bacterium]|nr:UDP-N-acetylmuramoyl-L-alanyl-D-glutamate--2,6-diaminopimelate ligase [Candidatus Obscuribacterales bacterium]